MATPITTRREQVLNVMRSQPPGHRFHLRDIAEATGMDTNNVSMTLSKIRSSEVAPVTTHGDGYWSLAAELSREQAADALLDSIVQNTPLKVTEPEQPEVVFHGEDCPGHTTGLPGESCFTEAAAEPAAGHPGNPADFPARLMMMALRAAMRGGHVPMRTGPRELPGDDDDETGPVLRVVGTDTEENKIVIDEDNGQAYRLVAL
jgi:alkylated DNA nucleotide flippase Atl1